MRNMHLQITGNLMGDTTPEELVAQIIGADAFLVPGTLFTDDTTATIPSPDEAPTFVVVETNLICDEEVTDSPDWMGEKVTQDFVQNYVLGAGPHWASADGDMFFPVGAVAEIR